MFTSVEASSSIEETATTTATLSVAEEEEYERLTSLCVEFLLGLESVPGENSGILSPCCALIYPLSRRSHIELEYHLLEAINHLVLLGLPSSYHSMPDKVKERFVTAKGEDKDDDDEEKDDNAEDEGEDEDEDDYEMETELDSVRLSYFRRLTLQFTPFSPSISAKEVLTFENHLLEKLRVAPTSLQQTLCLSITLITAASHEFACGKDSDLHRQVVELLVDYIISG